MDQIKRRTFIKSASAFATAIPFIDHQTGTSRKKPLIDNIWLWGHSAGAHHKPVNVYNLPGVNLMEPKQACEYLGIGKCCRVALGEHGPFPPFEKEAKALSGLKEVVWSAIGDGSSRQHDGDRSDIDEVLRISDQFENISGAILDDFFITPTPDGRVARHSLESIKDMRNRLHRFGKRKLDLWLVWYTHQLNYELAGYIELFDVITFWEWKGSNLENLDANMKEFIKKTPGKRRLAGCYLWNYGEKKPMTRSQMEHQLEVCYSWITKGEIEGIVFCASTVVDIGLESVAYVRSWISKYGPRVPG